MTTTNDVVKRHFEITHQALYELVGLFITGPLSKATRDPVIQSKVRNAISVLAQLAKDGVKLP